MSRINTEQPLEPLQSVSQPSREVIKIEYQVGSDPGLEKSIRDGRTVIGKLNVFKRWGSNLAFVRSAAFPRDVVVNKQDFVGQLDKDIVAVTLLPKTQWKTLRSPDTKSHAEEEVTTTKQRTQLHERLLPDGRPIMRFTLSEAETGEGVRTSPIAQLSKSIGAPASFAWDSTAQPVGEVVRVLWREMDAYQIGRAADNVWKPGQPINDSFAYRFKLYNPLLPQVAVYGRDIPSHVHRDFGSYLFFLRLTTTAEGAVVPVFGDILQARIHNTVGRADSVDANTFSICSTYSIPSENFSDEAEMCVPEECRIPDAAELASSGRRDLRDTEFVCTIDPSTARDLDDALSITRTPRGGYHVGVHIADVSHFVEPKTALDEEAQERSNSTYFVHKVVPMLPRRLSENYCSLNPAEDKLAFSALFELDEAAHVTSEWFGQSIIRSRCRLAYEQAQQILDGEAIELDVSHESQRTGISVERLQDKVFESVRLLFEVASKRRTESIARGRLTIGNATLAFALEDMNSRLSPKGFFVSRQIEANWLVEEFMLLANARVAEKIVQFLPQEAYLRQHTPPRHSKICEVREALKKCHVRLLGSSAKALQDTLDECKGTPVYDAVCQLLKYSLSPAQYVCYGDVAEFPCQHFALGLPWYTHFTSPIRRYSDIMTHRQLRVALEVEERMRASGMELPRAPDASIEDKPGAGPFVVAAAIDPTTLKTKDLFYSQSTVSMIAENATLKQENSRFAGEASVQLFFCLYLEALRKKALVDPRVSPVQYTSVVVIKLSQTMMTLYSTEVASEVSIGFGDTHQRFVKRNPEPEEDDAIKADEKRSPLDAKAKSARESAAADAAKRRSKGGKKDKPKHPAEGESRGSADNTAAPVVLSWGTNPTTGVEELEEVSLFSTFVVALSVETKSGRQTLQMTVLPPFERSAHLQGSASIPTSLI